MNEFKLCNICNSDNVESLVSKLKEVDASAIVEIGCQGLCAIGATKLFVIVNGIPAIGITEDEVIEKVKEILKS